MKFKVLIYIGAFVITFCGCSGDPEITRGQFEVFLLNDTSVRVQRYSATHLDDLYLADSPWITASDILSYDWEVHEITFKENAASLLVQFRNEMSGPDIPFVVVANGERIYMGVFPWGASSHVGPYVTIMLAHGEQAGVRFGRPMLQPSPDPRNDVRIRECLEEARILAD